MRLVRPSAKLWKRHRQPGRLQQPAEKLGAGLFVARRIDGAQADEVLRQCDGGHGDDGHGGRPFQVKS